MATRNKARKSTGPRGAQRPSTSSNITSNTQSQRKRRTNANFSLQRLPSSSSESEAETQPLNIHSSPGPSRINRLRIRSSSDSDPDGPIQRPTRGKNTRIVQRQKSSSSGSTTSDSDQIPGRDSIQKENKNTRTKRRKITKPEASNRRKRTRKPSSSSETDEASKTSPLKTSPSKRLGLPQRYISLANKCVYFLLIADQKKHVIKKTEIVKYVFNNQAPSKLYVGVIEEANKILKQTYGLEILTSEKRKGEYMLINALKRDIDIQDFVELSPLELQKQGLIFYLLTVIFMNENSISENDLWESLKPLGIDATSKVPHPIFGDVKKYLTNELVKQMYLEYKCISKDPPEFEFTLGERVKQVIEKKDLLDFACKIMDDTSPQEWILQYNDAVDATREDE